MAIEYKIPETPSILDGMVSAVKYAERYLHMKILYMQAKKEQPEEGKIDVTPEGMWRDAFIKMYEEHHYINK